MPPMVLHQQSGQLLCKPVRSLRLRPTSARRCRPFSPALKHRFDTLVVRATPEEEAFENRLANLRKAKGATPYGEGSKASKYAKPATAKAETAPKQQQQQVDYSNEQLYYEGPPHVGDLATNVVLGATLVWLPLSIAAIGRYAFVKYRFTDLRMTICTTAPWKNESTSVAYQDVQDVKTVGRGIGLWGDMVVTLSNGDKVELRALDRFMELKTYILDRRDALKPSRKDFDPMLDDMPQPKAKKGFA